MHSLWQDIQYGFRTLTQRPGFTLAAVVALGLGIGANTAIFGVVNGLMFRPLPVRQAGDLVAIVGKTSQARFMHTLSYPDVRDYGEMKDVFADVVAYGPNTARLTTEGNPERIMVTLASGNYFSLLKLELERGRGWQPEEGDLGGEPVIVLDYNYWQSRFGGDPSVIGSTVHLNGQPVTILGVTPEIFPGTVGFIRGHAYVPFSTWELLSPEFEETLDNRSARVWRVVARLANGVDIDEARAAVTTMAAHLEEEYPESNKTLRAFVYPEPIARLEPSAVSYLPPVVTVFMLLVSLVLLIACANAANLLLARASERRREMAIRASLGAGRFRILRQLVTESVLIALAGGIVGLVLAHWAGNLLASLRVASDVPLYFDFSIDYRVFGYAMLVALAAGLLAGLAPGVYAARTNLVDALKEGGRSGAGTGRHRVRSVLVAAQVAVSLVLLICTALFVQSMRNITEVDPGFEYENRIMLSLDASLLNYDEERGQAFYRDLLERVRTLPGVRAAATACFVHIGYNNGSRRVFLEGEGEGIEEEDDLHNAMFNVVSSDYFLTLGISLLDGRVITDRDDTSARPVAVVNNKMAEDLWPGQNALGKRFSVEGPGGPFIDVIGIVETGFYAIPGEPPQLMYYTPLSPGETRRSLCSNRSGSGRTRSLRGHLLLGDPANPRDRPPRRSGSELVFDCPAGPFQGRHPRAARHRAGRTPCLRSHPNLRQSAHWNQCE